MQIILLSIIIILALIYVLKKRLLVTLAGFLHFLFFTSLIFALCALFLQAPFSALAKYTLEQNGTLTTIQEIDNSFSLNTLKDAGNSLLNTLNKWLGSDETNTPSDSSKTEGLLEKAVYPGLVTSVAGTYRTITLIFSFVGMVLAIYLSFSISGTSEIENLKQRIMLLESKSL